MIIKTETYIGFYLDEKDNSYNLMIYSTDGSKVIIKWTKHDIFKQLGMDLDGRT